MKKRILSAILSVAMLASLTGAFSLPASAADGLRANTRQVEYLTRGVVAVKVDGGIYLSWRLLGTEPLTQKFDIYRDGKKIKENLDATNFKDDGGFSYNTYQVVPAGTAAEQVDLNCDKTAVWQNNYIDIPLDKPAGGVTKAGESYTYSVNDTSVADVDGDGEYEYIIKWDPSNSKDNSFHGQTGNVLLDCYKLDGTKLWRIDLGINIRAGAHYTQFIAYDFDGDGKAEVAMRTAPGSKDSTGGYVSRVGGDPKLGTGVKADPFTWADSATGTVYKDTDDLRQTGSKSGHIIKGPDWLTMFNGETGEAMQTVNYPVQRGSVKSWGDNYGGRSERNVAGMAYLDGVHPSLIMCRGYYARASMGAYNWDGKQFTKLWVRDDKEDAKNTLFTNGNHQLSVADMDNDGKDEVTIGSAAVDDDGSMLHSTGHGHGDALHVSDFNNDGRQEVFTVHEEKTYYKTWGAELRRGSNTDGSSYFGDSIGSNILAYTPANADNGRGVMANIDDDYAYANGFHSYYWSVADGNLYKDNGSGKGAPVTVTSTVDGKEVTTNVSQPGSCNSLIYWDGDLSRELLDRNRIDKFSIEGTGGRLATFDGVHSNNGSKANAAISADLFGDWREEVAFGTSDDTALRIFTTTTPTDYKLTTLMHDTQYRCAIAWQNVGYNQPPHTSYYIGKDSLKSGANYLEPKAGFDKVAFAHTPTKTVPVPDEEITLMSSSESFDNGNWGIGTKTSTAAPYNNIVNTSSGTTTKELNLTLTSDEETYVTLTSFTLNDNNTATAVVNNGTANYFGAKLYVAAYTSGDVLSDVKIADIAAAAEKTATVTSEAVTVPSGGYVKAFLWDSNETPYTEPLTAQNKSITNRKIVTDNGKVESLKFAFDWKPNASSNSVTIASAEGGKMVELTKSTGTAMRYASGTNASAPVNATLTANDWYHVDITMDLTSKTADISVLDYTASNAEEKIVYAASFAGVEGDPQKLIITNAASLDNIDISSVKYNISRSLVNFNVKDKSGAAVKDAKVSIGGTTLTTDDNGNASIKVKSGDYSYTVSKTAKKTVKGTVSATETSDISATLNDGETRDVYIKYMFDNAMDITEAVAKGEAAVKIGTATENTTYSIPDSAKADINGYTFPSDAEDIAPGYEDYAGQTVNLEFDPDKSDVVNVNVAEGADTTIVLSYKLKLVPTETDTELLRIQYGEGGIGSDGANWSVTSNAYEKMTDSGKYIRIGNLGTSTLTVNIPNASSNMVMEFDMKYEDMPWGGNYFGVTPYNGNSAGQGFGMRTSSEANGQWQLCYRSGGDQYLARTLAASDRGYSYAYNWKNQWMHIVIVSDGTQLKVTQANKDTGMVFIQDQTVPLANGIGSASKPINKLVFGLLQGSGNAVVGFKNFKAYVPGEISVGGGVETAEKTIDIPSNESFAYTTSASSHPSDMAGVTYDASGIMNVSVTYKLLDESDNEASPAGYTLSSDGTLTVEDGADTSQHYSVGVYLNGVLKKKTRLSYILKTEIFKSVFNGDTQGFEVTPSDDSTVVTSASGGQLNVVAKNSQSNVTISKAFDGANNGKVEIQFDVKNGGTKVDGTNWNWTGNEFEMDIDMLDSSQNSILNINEAWASSAGDVYYSVGGGSKAKIIDNWAYTKVSDGYDLKGSARIWTVKAVLDFDSKKADFMISSHPGGDNVTFAKRYDLTNVDISSISDLKTLKLTGTKKGAGLYWEPYIANLTVYKYATAE